MSYGPFCYRRRVWSTSFPFSRTAWGKDSQPALEVLKGAKSGGHSLWMNRAKECSMMEQNHLTIRSVPYSSTVPFSFISTWMPNRLLEARCWDLRAKVMGEGGEGPPGCEHNWRDTEVGGPCCRRIRFLTPKNIKIHVISYLYLTSALSNEKRSVQYDSKKTWKRTLNLCIFFSLFYVEGCGFSSQRKRESEWL